MITSIPKILRIVEIRFLKIDSFQPMSSPFVLRIFNPKSNFPGVPPYFYGKYIIPNQSPMGKNKTGVTI
jgi:hypothetical protein